MPSAARDGNGGERCIRWRGERRTNLAGSGHRDGGPRGEGQSRTYQRIEPLTKSPVSVITTIRATMPTAIRAAFEG